MPLVVEYGLDFDFKLMREHHHQHHQHQQHQPSKMIINGSQRLACGIQLGHGQHSGGLARFHSGTNTHTYTMVQALHIQM